MDEEFRPGGWQNLIGVSFVVLIPLVWLVVFLDASTPLASDWLSVLVTTPLLAAGIYMTVRLSRERVILTDRAIEKVDWHSRTISIPYSEIASVTRKPHLRNPASYIVEGIGQRLTFDESYEGFRDLLDRIEERRQAANRAPKPAAEAARPLSG